MFGRDAVSTQQSATSNFLKELIITAETKIGTLEIPLGSNKGPRVK